MRPAVSDATIWAECRGQRCRQRPPTGSISSLFDTLSLTVIWAREICGILNQIGRFPSASPPSVAELGINGRPYNAYSTAVAVRRSRYGRYSVCTARTCFSAGHQSFMWAANKVFPVGNWRDGHSGCLPWAGVAHSALQPTARGVTLRKMPATAQLQGE